MVTRPLLAHRIRRREARRVVDHGPAAERRALQDDESQIARREQAARVVHRLQRLALLMCEVRLVAVATLLQRDDILAASRQLGGDDPATGARAYDNDVAHECRVATYRERADWLWCVGWNPERPGIADRATGPWRRVVGNGGEAFERLKCFATLRDSTRRPAAQIALALGRRHGCERARRAAQQKIHDAAFKQSQQQVELGAVGAAREGCNHAGDALTQIGWGILNERIRDSAQDFPRGR